MPRGSIMQMLDKPSRTYNSSQVNFYSLATDPDRRRKAASDAGSYAGSDTDSIASGMTGSVYSARSLGRAHRTDGRRFKTSGMKYSSIHGWTSSVSTLAASDVAEEGPQTSRSYGKMLTPGFNKQEGINLRSKSTKDIDALTRDARAARLRTQSMPRELGSRNRPPAIQTWGNEDDEQDQVKPTRKKAATVTRRSSVGSASSETLNSQKGQPAWVSPHPLPPDQAPVQPATKPREIIYNNQLPVKAQAPGLTAANLAQLRHREITAALPPSANQTATPTAVIQQIQPTRQITPPDITNVRSLHRLQEEEEPSEVKPTTDQALSFPHNLTHSIASESARPSPPDSPPYERAVYRQAASSPATETESIPLLSHQRLPNPLAAFTLTAFSILLAAHSTGSRQVCGTIASARDHVEVVVRVTKDNWLTQSDIVAVVDRSRLNKDEWDFTALVDLTVNDRVEMAVKMFGDGKIVWDSDGGKNYSAHVSAPSSPAIGQPLSRQMSRTGSNQSARAMAPDTDTGPGHVVQMRASIGSDADSYVSTKSQLDAIPMPPRILLTRTPSATTPSGNAAVELWHSVPVKQPPAFSEAEEAGFAADVMAAIKSEADKQATTDRSFNPVAREAADLQTPKATRTSSLPPMQYQSSVPPVMSMERKPSINGSLSSPRPQASPNLSETNTSAHPRADEGIASLGQLFQPHDFMASASRPGSIVSTTFSQGTAPPLPTRSPKRGYAPSAQSSVSRNTTGRLPLPINGGSSRTVRKSALRANWSADCLLDPKIMMCALCISRVKGGPGVLGSLPQKGSQKQKKDSPGVFSDRKFLEVSFSTTAETPSKLRSSEVLVQVLATALDGLDSARVETLISRMDGLNYVPGRSFCGRIVEAGADVKLKKGDIVFGLQDLEKSGCLAELMVVDKRNIAKAPNDKLSIEQVAALPISGVPALVAVRQLSAALPKGARILVLNAHVGTGYLAARLFSILRPGSDLYVAAQVPADTLEAEALCKANGVNDVFRDEPLVAMNRIHEASFDVVLDTVGGRRIYDASRRILCDDGYFCTLLGDDLSPPTFRSQWKNSLRSLRRAFVKKDRKSISYWLPMAAEIDIRSSLVQLTEYAEEDDLIPVVSRVWRFEEGKEAFGSRLDGGTVVKISET